jgi:hypothetical protein
VHRIETVFMTKTSNSLKNLFLSEIEADLANTCDYSRSIIREKDILNLPEPVQRYCGYIGKEKMVNARQNGKI